MTQEDRPVSAADRAIYTGQVDPRIRTRIVTAAFLALIALVAIGSLLKHP